MPPSRRPAPVEEPASLDIGSSGAAAMMEDPEDMLAVTEDQTELARQITSRPPVHPPVHPPLHPPVHAPPRPPAERSTSAQPPSPAPPSQLPARSRPPTAIRPLQPGADDALLTPQELATAFQLNFSPNGKDHASMPRRSKGLAAVVLLLLIGAGVAALMSLRPDLRHKISAWGERTIASVKSFIVSRTSPAGMSGSSGSSGTLGTHPSGAAVTPAPAGQSAHLRHEPVVIAPPPAPPLRTVVVSEAPPVPAPALSPKAIETPNAPRNDAAAAAAGAAQTATGTLKADASPAEAPKPAPAPPSAASAAPAHVIVTSTDPYDRARELWSKAIDAEANQDYVEAVRCYEEIQKLPPDVQPRALPVRLDLARKLMK